MERLGVIDGREVWVRTCDGGAGQEVLFEYAGRCGLLAQILAKPWDVKIEEHEGRTFAVVAHDEKVDRFLVTLIDILVNIRVSHPTMVQLPLALEVAPGVLARAFQERLL